MTDKKCDHEWDNEREICLKCAMYWDIFIQIEKAYANGRNDEVEKIIEDLKPENRIEWNYKLKLSEKLDQLSEGNI